MTLKTSVVLSSTIRKCSVSMADTQALAVLALAVEPPEYVHGPGQEDQADGKFLPPGELELPDAKDG